MNESNEKRVSYVLVTRYVARWGARWESSIVPAGEYHTHAEARKVVTRMIRSKLGKTYKRKKNHVLVEIRIELYRRTQNGDRRLRSLSFEVKPRRKAAT